MRTRLLFVEGKSEIAGEQLLSGRGDEKTTRICCENTSLSVLSLFELAKPRKLNKSAFTFSNLEHTLHFTIQKTQCGNVLQ